MGEYQPIPTDIPIEENQRQSQKDDYNNALGGGLIRSKRNNPPANFTFKIKSYSLLEGIVQDTRSDGYKTQYFEASGYKWKLHLYPNGDPKRNGDGYISLYLVLADENVLSPGEEVNRDFKLFLYNQLEDNYLCVEDGGGTEGGFHCSKTHCGFSQFIPLTIFNDPSNGYLINDCCAFGAEICGSTKESTIEGFSEVLGASDSISHTWKLTFSELVDECYYSQWFNAGGRRWRMVLKPKGFMNKYVSLDLELEKPKTYSNILEWFQGWFQRNDDKYKPSLYVHFKLSMKDQVQDQHHFFTLLRYFDEKASQWGVNRFILFDDLKDSSKGYVVNDTLIVKAKLSLIYVDKSHRFSSKDLED